jgi:hypothetical protein
VGVEASARRDAAVRAWRGSGVPGPAPVVPPDLAVVKMAPPPPPAPPAAGRGRALRTDVPVRDPDPALLASLSPGDDLAARAAAELAAAREAQGIGRARALETFARRFPHHPAADDALLEASRARAAGGDGDAACALAERVARDYPAGDAVPDALADLAACQSRAGDASHAHETWQRLATDYPESAAARRAPSRQGATP